MATPPLLPVVPDIPVLTDLTATSLYIFWRNQLLVNLKFSIRCQKLVSTILIFKSLRSLKLIKLLMTDDSLHLPDVRYQLWFNEDVEADAHQLLSSEDLIRCIPREDLLKLHPPLLPVTGGGGDNV